jgi:hypothetical protein
MARKRKKTVPKESLEELRKFLRESEENWKMSNMDILRELKARGVKGLISRHLHTERSACYKDRPDLRQVSFEQEALSPQQKAAKTRARRAAKGKQASVARRATTPTTSDGKLLPVNVRAALAFSQKCGSIRAARKAMKQLEAVQVVSSGK